LTGCRKHAGNLRGSIPKAGAFSNDQLTLMVYARARSILLIDNSTIVGLNKA